MICALTGHRDLPENFDAEALRNKLEELINQGVTTFLCGMARGFDTLAILQLILLKRQYPIRLVAYLPFKDCDRRRDSAVFAEALAHCDEIHTASPHYTEWCFLTRDRMMVDRCDVVLAYLTRTEGGTYYTVGYAKRNRKKIVYIS